MNPVLRQCSAALLLGAALLMSASSAAGQVSVYSSGCSALFPVPTVSHSGALVPFATQTITLAGAPPNALVLLVIGTSNTDASGNPLAIDVSGLPDIPPGCELNTSVEVQLFLNADSNGELSFSFPLKPAWGPSLNFQFGFYESLAPPSVAISPALEVALPLTATVIPEPVTFAPQHVGESESLTVTLENNTGKKLTITDLILFDGDASDFSIAPTSFPFDIKVGKATTFDVTFSPTSSGERFTRLQVVHSGLPAGFTDPLIDVNGMALGPAGQELYINTGDLSPYFNGGPLWLGDFGFAGGVKASTPDPIAGTSDEGLYQSWRQGNAFQYDFALPPGTYGVTMHFVEPVHTAPGLRAFDVRVEGALAVDDLDVFAQVGHDTAYQVHALAQVSDGNLDINLFGVVDQALLCGLEVASVFPAVTVTPEAHDFGFQALGSSTVLPLTLDNAGTADGLLDAVTFHMHSGAGADFELDIAGQTYVGDPDMGPHHEVTFPVSIPLPVGQSVPATLTFTPADHAAYMLQLQFEGDFDTAILSAVGNGGAAGHPFLHVVIEPVGQPVDWDGDGFETVTLDGSFSHTHEPGQELVGYTWTEGATTLALAESADVSFAVGEHSVCLTIEDDNAPAETLSDCVVFEVAPVTAVPGVLAQYVQTGATSPVTVIEDPFGPPDWTETLGDLRLTGEGGVGGSPFATNVLARLVAELDVTLPGTYEFLLVGGTDARLWIDGLPYASPVTLAAGLHDVEVRFAVEGLSDLPAEVLFGLSGGALDPVDPAQLTHDESADPPQINTMTSQGSTLGGNTVVIDGFGFFPPDQATVHWGGTDFGLADFVSWSSTRIILLSPAQAPGTVSVTVETPLGTSNAVDFEYSASGPPPIAFTLATAASMTRPTCGTWGPDGRFYVGRRFGQITALTFDEDYGLLAQQQYTALSGLSNHEILGITTNPFDPPDPVRLYVAHSELYAQGGSAFTGPAPYPGQISILEGPLFDTPIPYITGLPTSNHDHAINGITFDNNGDLLITVGSNTNAGIPDPDMGTLDESPLTAAVLKARTSDPGFNGTITYVETVGGAPNDDQVFGHLVDVAPGVDVEVHAPGLRNPFDMVYTTTGRLYATDNGPNTSFGPASTGATTQSLNDAVTPDELLHVERGRYYGAANRARGRVDDRQNVFRGTGEPTIPEQFAQAMQILSSSSDGIDEYRATTFQNQMRGELIVQRWNGVATRVELSDDGREVVSTTQILPTTSALGLRTGPGGAMLLMDFTANAVKTLLPQDVGATVMQVYDVFPWRAPATGGTPFVLGGHAFGTLANTVVQFGGIPATLTSVSAKRIEGVVPPAAVLGTDLIDITVDSAGATSVLPDAFRYLFVPAGNEPGRWEDLPDLPLALGEVACATIGGVLYVVGEGGNATYAYDLYGKTWSTVAPRPFAGHHSAGEVVNGKWYLFGGIGGGSAGKLQIYNPATNQWTTGPDMPWNASSSATALIDGKIYIAGGMVNGLFTVGDTVVFDPATNLYTPLAPMPLPRNHAAAATDGQKLWVFGGRGPGSGDGNVVANGFDDVQVYDPIGDVWESDSDPGSTLLPLPVARGGMGKAVFKDGAFHIFGGETLNGPGATVDGVFDRVDVYDPVAGSWRLEAPMPSPRHGVYPVLFEGRVFLAGGGLAAGFAQSTVCDVYDRQ